MRFSPNRASYCAIYQCNLPAETVAGKLKNFHGQFTAAFNNANQFNAGEIECRQSRMRFVASRRGVLSFFSLPPPSMSAHHARARLIKLCRASFKRRAIMAVHNNVPIKRRQRKNFRDRGTIATRSIRLGNALKLFIIVARKNARGEDPTLLPSLRSTNAILVRDEKQRDKIFP